MKLHLTTAENNNLITGYGESYIEINKQRYAQNLIVMPQTIVVDWHAENVSALNNEHFQELIKLKPEVVLLGTGKTHVFLHPKNHQILTEHGIALECMTTAAACRTYNILMSEGRLVAAALIL